MNNTRFKQIAIFVLVTIIAIGLPASFAKYMKDDSFNLNVKVEVPFTFTADTVTGENVSDGKITIKKSGWYAIAVKGGDGGSGTVVNGDVVDNVPGGPGGLVIVKTWLEKDQVLLTYVGSAGGNGKKGTPGAAGTTSAIGSGGKGSTDPTDNATGLITAIQNWIAEMLSNAVASGGGGAATSVYVGSKDSSNLLCVAGGGGGAGGWSSYYSYPNGTLYVKTVPSGRGGAGGSNILSNTSTEPNSVNSGLVYIGDNGKLGYFPVSGDDKGYYIYRMVDGKPTYGFGGTANSAGAGGSKITVDVTITISLTSSGVSASGSDGANSQSYGGAGGGGYYGGGSGSGNSISYSAGGGGGGSSFHKSSLNGKGVTMYNDLSNLGLNTASVTYKPYRLNKIGNYMTKKNNYSNNPDSEKFSMYNVTKNGANVANGFVVVKYLGQS